MIRKLSISVCTVFLLAAVMPLFAADEKMTAESLVAHHLDSVGKPEARAAIKSRVAEGTVTYEILTGGSGRLDGKLIAVSEGRKLRIVQRYSGSNPNGEDFICDGEKVDVALLHTGTRTAFGEIVQTQKHLLREGIIGGLLTTAWPLLNLPAHQVKLSYNGLKKVKDRELHELTYNPKKRGDMDIRMYFDPETYRHVMTVYTMTVSPGLAEVPAGWNREQYTARQQQLRYRIEESFENFEQTQGLMLPTKWTVHFTIDGYESAVQRWTMAVRRFEHNISLDARNFLVK